MDYSEKLLKIAEQNLKDTGKCIFAPGAFQNIEHVLEERGINFLYDKILINGVLMYINDAELVQCLESVNRLLNVNGLVYIKESVGIQKRFTLKDFYSQELDSSYNAIYRSLHEYEVLFQSIFTSQGFKVVSSGSTWNKEQENRSETASYYWVFEKV